VAPKRAAELAPFCAAVDKFETDRWELYHLERDFAEIRDLAAAEPDRLRALIDLWWVEAGKYGVLPLDDRDWERAAARLRMSTRTRYDYQGRMARADRLSSPDITDRSYTITAAIVLSEEPLEGVIVAWGSRFAGFVLYVKGGEIAYEYVYSESVRHELRAPLGSVTGTTTIQLRFERTAKNAGRARLFIGAREAGSIDIPKTWPTHGTTAGLNCGYDAGAPVSDAYPRPFALNARDLRLSVVLEGATGAAPGAAYGAALREQ
jgi:arylsulfatase